MKPLVNFDELLNWEGSDPEEICLINYNGQEFQEMSGAYINEKSLSIRNKVLLCHDMKGGYLDDKTIEKNENIYAYRFYNWNLIDIFVYFSHHFVTIPPSGWTTHCHKNGVQCLGTVITEDNKSPQFRRVFEEADNVEIVAQKLTKIKSYYNFDGWLINIECSCQYKIASQTVANMKLLLRRLIELGNEVYWYDAVTESGQLHWQNGLTKHNQSFFDLCGNIFLNYGWTHGSLTESAAISQGHCHRVFVGIDCFGRGCYGGGGFNCDLACQEIERVFDGNQSNCKSKFSIALFAPGWCWETLSPSKLDKKLNENIWLFFSKLEPYLNPWADGRRVYRQLPSVSIYENSFSTNFDIGQGVSDFHNGTQVIGDNYNRLSDQNLMPTGLVTNGNSDVVIKLLPTRKISYHGHSCMTMTAQYVSKKSASVAPCSIVVELFRMGCLVDRDHSATLRLVIGRDREVAGDTDIWAGLQLAVRFTEAADHSDVRVAQFLLDHMEHNQSNSPLPPVEWRIFEIDNLLEALSTMSSSITVRKIDIIIMNGSVIDYLTKGSIYFGHLSIS